MNIFIVQFILEKTAADKNSYVQDVEKCFQDYISTYLEKEDNLGLRRKQLNGELSETLERLLKEGDKSIYAKNLGRFEKYKISNFVTQTLEQMSGFVKEQNQGES